MIPDSKRNDKRFRILFKVAAILKALHVLYGGLKTWSDWLDLYIKLWSDEGEEMDILQNLKENPEVHPYSFNDLAHKTTLCFQSKHRVRFPFAEAQKRVCGAVCSLTNWKPTTEVKYHEFGGYGKKWMIEPDEVFTADTNLNTEKETNDKIKSCAKIVPIMFMMFRDSKGEGLNETILAFLRELSKKWTISGDKSEKRDWNQMVFDLCKEPILRKAVRPPFYNYEMREWIPEVTWEPFSEWATKVRRMAVEELYSQNQECQILKRDLDQALKEVRDSKKCHTPVIISQEAYADFCTLQAIGTKAISDEQKKYAKKDEEMTEAEIIVKLKRQRKNGLNMDGGIYLQKPPTPNMPNMIASIFSYMASGAASSLDSISKMAVLNGARVDNPKFKTNLVFFENETGYKTSVCSKQNHGHVALS
jgi:hypothetical protein